ncbi:MAG: hypothetical protein IIB39_10175 [Candidatus Marinimicrobia bacterium]|nr:hypothetical protein [Candidatus Neomarinimicrobiota bacterium]
MIAFPILGGFLILFGLLFLFLPSQLLKITGAANTIFPVDQQIFKHRFLVGILMILSSLLLYYVSRILLPINTVLSVTSLILGVIILVFSAILILNPRLMEKINEVGGKVIATDEITLVHRKVTGLLFISAGSFMIYSWM